MQQNAFLILKMHQKLIFGLGPAAAAERILKLFWTLEKGKKKLTCISGIQDKTPVEVGKVSAEAQFFL